MAALRFHPTRLALRVAGFLSAYAHAANPRTLLAPVVIPSTTGAYRP